MESARISKWFDLLIHWVNSLSWHNFRVTLLSQFRKHNFHVTLLSQLRKHNFPVTLYREMKHGVSLNRMHTVVLFSFRVHLIQYCYNRFQISILFSCCYNTISHLSRNYDHPSTLKSPSCVFQNKFLLPCDHDVHKISIR